MSDLDKNCIVCGQEDYEYLGKLILSNGDGQSWGNEDMWMCEECRNCLFELIKERRNIVEDVKRKFMSPIVFILSILFSIIYFCGFYLIFTNPEDFLLLLIVSIIVIITGTILPVFMNIRREKPESAEVN